MKPTLYPPRYKVRYLTHRKPIQHAHAPGAMARLIALLALLGRVSSLKPTTRRRIINGAAAAVIGALPMAAVAQEKGLGFGEAIGKELGIVDGCVEINQCVGCTIILH